MIATYQQLLADVLPERIDTETLYDSTRSRFGELLVKSRLTGPVPRPDRISPTTRAKLGKNPRERCQNAKPVSLR